MSGLRPRPPACLALILLFSTLTLSCAPRPAVANNPGINPGILEIGGPELQKYRQVVALSDRHGHYLNTRLLLHKAGVVDEAGKWSAGNTLVVVVGDTLDKGPSSLKLLHLWMDLQEQAKAAGGRVVNLLGNHEAEFLADPAGDTKTELLQQELSAEGMTLEQLASSTKDKEGYTPGAFLHQMPLALKLGNWLFCHAGWLPDAQVIAPGQVSDAARWAELKRQAAQQTYVALTDEDFARGKPGPFFATLEKKYTGEESSTAAKDAGAVKWWDDKPEVTKLLARLCQYGLTGVVFGHQPAAFNLIHTVGSYSNPDTKAPDYRLLKIDSGEGETPADGPDAAGNPSYCGSLLKFTEIKVFLTSPKEFQPEIPFSGLQTVGDRENSKK